jgi:hypothetical protein
MQGQRGNAPVRSHRDRPGAHAHAHDRQPDLTQLKPQHIEELIEQLDDLTVDVDDPDAKVQVFCE